MELLIRILSLIGVIALAVFCFWLMMKIPIKKSKSKYPWGHDGSWYYGKEKRQNKKLVE